METRYKFGIKNEYGDFTNFSYLRDLETTLEQCLDETVRRLQICSTSRLSTSKAIEIIYKHRFNCETDESYEVQKEKIKNLMRKELKETGEAHAYYENDYMVFEERRVFGINLADFTEDELEKLCEEIHEELGYRSERENWGE